MRHALLLIFLSVFQLTFAQEFLGIYNPSFETEHIPIPYMEPPKMDDWVDCSYKYFEKESAFDIQPGLFSCTKESRLGDTYVGLVTRVNGSYESICQELGQTIEKDSVYKLTIFLAKSEFYRSGFRADTGVHNFTNPVVLNVWGGTELCAKDELLYQVGPVEHTHWKEYYIPIYSKTSDYQFLSFEAFYPNSNEPTNGNILLDAINSDFNRIRDRLILMDYTSPELVEYIYNKLGNFKGAHPTVITIKSLKKLIEYESRISKYFKRLSLEELNNIIYELDKVNAVEYLNIFEELYRLNLEYDGEKAMYKKDIQNCSERFERIMEKRHLDDYLVQFASLKREEIITEILDCLSY